MSKLLNLPYLYRIGYTGKIKSEKNDTFFIDPKGFDQVSIATILNKNGISNNEFIFGEIIHQMHEHNIFSNGHEFKRLSLISFC